MSAAGEPCQHEHFAAEVDVGRLSAVEGGPVTSLIAEVTILCLVCGEQLRMPPSVPVGYLPQQVTRTLDGTKLHVPLWPADPPEDWNTGPGYLLHIDHGEGLN